MGLGSLKIDDFDSDLPMKGMPRQRAKFNNISFGIKAGGVKRGESLSNSTRDNLVAVDLAYQRTRQRELAEGVDFLSRQIRERAMDVEIPDGATHKLVGGLFPGVYVKFIGLSDDRQALVIEFMTGHRKGMLMRAMPDLLVDVKSGQPDSSLARKLSMELEQGTRVSAVIGSKYRK